MAEIPSIDLSAIETSADLPLLDENGVDLTLIRSYLKLTPLERLRSVRNAVRAIAMMRASLEKDA